MKICVYAASSNEVSRVYINAAEEFGKRLAEKGHTLVYGGGANGLMGAVARGVFAAKGNIIGVAPSFFNVDGVLFENCTEFIYTKTMRERKQIMEDISDAFVMLPGGIGTFDEFFEILTLRQLGRHSKPIAVLNTNGYYDNLFNMLTTSVTQGFMSEVCLKLCPSFSNSDKLIHYLENHTSECHLYKNLK